MRTRTLYNKGTQKNTQWNLVWFNSCGVQFPDVFKFYLDNESLLEVVVANHKDDIESPEGYTEDNITIKCDTTDITKSYIKYDYSTDVTGTKNFKIAIVSNYKPSPEQNTKKTEIICYSKELKDTDLDKNLIVEFKHFCVAKRFVIDDRHPEENEIAIQNYSNYQKGVACNLIQKLSIIKNELWWNLNWGLPLLEKVRNKSIIDSVIINITLSTRDVRNIVKLTSSVDKRTKTYSFDMIVETVWNEQINLSNVLSLL